MDWSGFGLFFEDEHFLLEDLFNPSAVDIVRKGLPVDGVDTLEAEPQKVYLGLGGGFPLSEVFNACVDGLRGLPRVGMEGVVPDAEEDVIDIPAGTQA